MPKHALNNEGDHLLLIYFRWGEGDHVQLVVSGSTWVSFNMFLLL